MIKHYSKWFLIAITFLCAILVGFSGATQLTNDDDRIISYTVDIQKQNVRLYWKDDKGAILKSIQNLKTFVENKNEKLLFAMNGGMYMQDNIPLGLFIQDEKQHTKLNTHSAASGNFYLKPNGVFYITTTNHPVICKTEDYSDTGKIKYATQSGPMLVIEGELHSAFKQGSTNLNIRNGVGILPDGTVLFAMSKTEINFYDFATYFKNAGCKNALYLDGFVSRMYLPEKNWIQTEGDFGVMIAVTTNNQ
jgi:uncharacterized protein YigE (DUF2233 family)